MLREKFIPSERGGSLTEIRRFIPLCLELRRKLSGAWAFLVWMRPASDGKANGTLPKLEPALRGMNLYSRMQMAWVITGSSLTLGRTTTIHKPADVSEAVVEPTLPRQTLGAFYWRWHRSVHGIHS